MTEQNISPLVVAKVAHLATEALLKLATLESQARTVPAGTRSSAAHLHLSKRIAEQRSIAQSWGAVSMMLSSDVAPAPAAEEPAALPGRVVGWVKIKNEATVIIVCDRHGGTCRWNTTAFPELPWEPVRLPEDDWAIGSKCYRCGQEVSE